MQNEENTRKGAYKYKWQKSVTLTPVEGKKLEEEILPKFYCDNVSQLVKKIVNGQIEIFDNH